MLMPLLQMHSLVVRGVSCAVLRGGRLHAQSLVYTGRGCFETARKGADIVEKGFQRAYFVASTNCLLLRVEKPPPIVAQDLQAS